MPIETLAFAAAIASGFLHAVWNAIAQRSIDPSGMIVSQLAFAGIAGAIACVFIGWPDSHVWHWMALGSVANAVAILLLAAGYKRGNYAVTYGINRAVVPWVLLPLSVLLVGGTVSTWSIAGVAAISLGVFLAATRGAAHTAESRGASGFAIASGVCVAFSIFSDARGALGAGALEYGVAQTALNAAVGSLLFRLQQKRPLFPLMQRNWRLAVASAIASTLSYLLILFAFTKLPTVVGSALRDSSMVFALFIGTIVFRETLRPWQWVGCGLFIVGVGVLRVG